MILSMLKSFGRSLWHFFVRPAPTSVALMVGEMPNAANDDQAQLLRRAMRAASQPEAEPAFETETTVTERKLTIVAAPAEDTSEEFAAFETDGATAALAEGETVQEAIAEEISPEGGTHSETNDAASASAYEEEEQEEEDVTLADENIEPVDEAPVEASGDTACGDEIDEVAEEQAVDEMRATALDEDPVEAGGDDEPVEDEPLLAGAVEDRVSLLEAAEDDELVAADASTESEESESEAAIQPIEAAEIEDDEPQESLVVSEEDAGDREPELGQAAAAQAELSDEDATIDALGAPAPESEEIMPAESASLAAAEEPAAEAVEETPAKKTRKKRASSPRKKKSSTKSSSRKGKAKTAEPVPEDDVWVSDAVVWSLSGEWIDGEWQAPEELDCPRRLEELRELAADGKLTIWGRSDEEAPWQAIAPSYWKSGVVEPASLAEGRENVVAEPNTKRKTARKYSALKVSKSQIEEIWQPDALH